MSGVQISPGELSRLTNSVLNATASSALVPAIAGTIIRVYRMFFTANSASTVTFQDGGTTLTGGLTFAANGAMILDTSGEPWFTCSAGNAFSVTLGGGTLTGMISFTRTGL